MLIKHFFNMVWEFVKASLLVECSRRGERMLVCLLDFFLNDKEQVCAKIVLKMWNLVARVIRSSCRVDNI